MSTSSFWLPGMTALAAALLALSFVLFAQRRRVAAALARLNAEIEQRIAERTMELAAARDQAEAASRAKSDFLAIISHEIRTPLNAVSGITTLLLDSQLTPTQCDDIETIRRSGKALLLLIDDLLDLSKIEAEKLNLEYQPFALRACIEEALDLLAPLADAKQLSLHFLPAPTLPEEFVGDPARLRQILVNLLSNAVRFTERGEISVSLTGAPQASYGDTPPMWDVVICVRDTGIGIAADHFDRIFQPFTQASPATTQRYGGSGLGLTISRRLVELMRGRLSVSSVLGLGSSFSVELALEASSAPLPSYLQPAQPLLARRRALLLTGSFEAGQYLADQLSAWGMLPSVFSAPSDALAWLRSGHSVDVLLINSDGASKVDLGLVTELRTASGLPSLPVVLWVGVSQRGLAFSQVDPATGVVLRLPIRPSALHDALQRLFRTEVARPSPQPPEFDVTLGMRHPLHILLAEDNVTSQEVAQRLLAKLGYQADVAASGLDVLEALRRQPYDLVLMDVQMPAMSGIETARYIRSFWPPEQQPRIAAMTAYAMEENRAWLLSTGMDDVVRKPVHLPDLVRALQATTQRLAREAPPPDSLHADKRSRPLDATLFAAFLAEVSTGDEASDKQFLERYFADMASQLATLSDARTSGNGRRHHQAAHILKGLSLQIGAVDLATLAGRIEAEGANGEAAPEANAAVALAELRRALDGRITRAS